MIILGLTFFTIISADNDKTLFKWDVGDVEKEFCQNTQDLYVRYKVEKKDAHQVSIKNEAFHVITRYLSFCRKKFGKKIGRWLFGHGKACSIDPWKLS